MAYIAANYKNNPLAPQGQWVCSPSSSLGPFTDPPKDKSKGPSYCGQCVSYVRTVCPSMPATGKWKKGALVKGNSTIVSGTAIATFNSEGTYEGHAAIYDSQTPNGINVYDQWISGVNPQPVKSRNLRFGAIGLANNGDNFYVVE